MKSKYQACIKRYADIVVGAADSSILCGWHIMCSSKAWNWLYNWWGGSIPFPQVEGFLKPPELEPLVFMNGTNSSWNNEWEKEHWHVSMIKKPKATIPNCREKVQLHQCCIKIPALQSKPQIVCVKSSAEKEKKKWGCQHIRPFVFNEVGRSEDKRSLQLAGSKIN